VAAMDLSPIVDYSIAPALSAPSADMGGMMIPDCRVILSIDVQIATHHLIDHIEWDLHSQLTPEEFAIKLCADLGLSGEAPPLVAHAIHEELIKHKRDAIEWGVVGGDQRQNRAGPWVGQNSKRRKRSKDITERMARLGRGGGI